MDLRILQQLTNPESDQRASSGFYIMEAKPVANAMLVLRLFTLAALVGAIALLLTNVKILYYDGNERTFKDFNSYRFVLSTAVIAAAYTLLQVPFAVYYAIKEKRMIRNGFLPDIDFYGDKVISLLLSAGVAAGFAISCEFKRFFRDVFALSDDQTTPEFRSSYDKFYNRGIVASGVLAVALVCMIVVSVLSSINRSTSTGRGFFK